MADKLDPSPPRPSTSREKSTSSKRKSIRNKSNASAIDEEDSIDAMDVSSTDEEEGSLSKRRKTNKTRQSNSEINGDPNVYPYACEMCPKNKVLRFKTPKGLRSHKAQTHDTQEVYCATCFQYASNRQNLKCHLNKAKCKNGKTCGYNNCEAKFKIWTDLIQHWDTEHREESKNDPYRVLPANADFTKQKVLARQKKKMDCSNDSELIDPTIVPSSTIKSGKSQKVKIKPQKTKSSEVVVEPRNFNLSTEEDEQHMMANDIPIDNCSVTPTMSNSIDIGFTGDSHSPSEKPSSENFRLNTSDVGVQCCNDFVFTEDKYVELRNKWQQVINKSRNNLCYLSTKTTVTPLPPVPDMEYPSDFIGVSLIEMTDMKEFRHFPTLVTYLYESPMIIAGAVMIRPPPRYVMIWRGYTPGDLNTKIEADHQLYVMSKSMRNEKAFSVKSCGMKHKNETLEQLIQSAKKCAPGHDNSDELEKKFCDAFGKDVVAISGSCRMTLFERMMDGINLYNLENDLNSPVLFDDSILPDQKSVLQLSKLKTSQLKIGFYEAIIPLQTGPDGLGVISYNHGSSPRTLFIVGAHWANKLQDEMEKLFPEQAEECKGFLHHKKVFILPSLLKELKIPYSKVVQTKETFLIIAAGSYFFGYDEGVNLTETTHFLTSEGVNHFKMNQYRCTCSAKQIELPRNNVVMKYQPERYLNFGKGEDQDFLPKQYGQDLIYEYALSDEARKQENENLQFEEPANESDTEIMGEFDVGNQTYTVVRTIISPTETIQDISVGETVNEENSNMKSSNKEQVYNLKEFIGSSTLYDVTSKLINQQDETKPSPLGRSPSLSPITGDSEEVCKEDMENCPKQRLHDNQPNQGVVSLQSAINTYDISREELIPCDMLDRQIKTLENNQVISDKVSVEVESRSDDIKEDD